MEPIISKQMVIAIIAAIFCYIVISCVMTLIFPPLGACMLGLLPCVCLATIIYYLVKQNKKKKD